MTIFSHKLFLLAFLSAATFLASPTSTHAKPSDLITNVCSKTRNATYCVDFLARYDRPGTTLQQLAATSIEDIKLVVFLAKDTIHAGGLQVTDPKVVLSYQLCEVGYDEAIKALTQWGESVKSGDFKKLASLASVALKKPADCDANFGPTNEEPRFIKDLDNQNLNICSIVLVMSNSLAAGKI